MFIANQMLGRVWVILVLSDELRDLATELYFQKHKQLGNFNTPEDYELEEDGYSDMAKAVIKEKIEKTYAITVWRDLIPSIEYNTKIRSFRKRQYRQKFYRVYCSSYPNNRCSKCPHCIIEMLEVEKVKPKDIKQEWAKEAGMNKKELLPALAKIYPNTEYYWMHTFRLVG